MKAHRGRQDNEVSCWTVAVGNFNPLMKASREAAKFINTLDGLVGVHPQYPRGVLILFESENAAKIGRNQMEAKGIQCGTNICECYVEKKYLRGDKNAE